MWILTQIRIFDRPTGSLDPFFINSGLPPLTARQQYQNYDTTSMKSSSLEYVFSIYHQAKKPHLQ